MYVRAAEVTDYKMLPVVWEGVLTSQHLCYLNAVSLYIKCLCHCLIPQMGLCWEKATPYSLQGILSTTRETLLWSIGEVALNYSNFTLPPRIFDKVSRSGDAKYFQADVHCLHCRAIQV